MFKSMHCLVFMIYVQHTYIYMCVCVYIYIQLFLKFLQLKVGGIWVLYLSKVSFLEQFFIFSCNGSLLLCIDFL